MAERLNLRQISEALAQLEPNQVFEYDGVRVKNIMGVLYANGFFKLHSNKDYAAQQVMRMTDYSKELERETDPNRFPELSKD